MRKKSALLIYPPIYDTQYWAEWSQPYGLLRIAALLRKVGYGKLWLYDFLETGGDRKVEQHRISFQESYAEIDRAEGKPQPFVADKDGRSVEMTGHGPAGDTIRPHSRCLCCRRP